MLCGCVSLYQAMYSTIARRAAALSRHEDGAGTEVGPGRARQKGAERNVFAATRRTYSRTAAHVQVRCIWSQDQMRAGVHNHGLVTGSCCSVSPEEATAQWLGARRE